VTIRKKNQKGERHRVEMLAWCTPPAIATGTILMTGKNKTLEGDIFSDDEAARRRDEVIRRMANTPPQPKATTPHRQKRKKKAVAVRAAGRARRED
jgi:hypothetical protein